MRRRLNGGCGQRAGHAEHLFARTPRILLRRPLRVGRQAAKIRKQAGRCSNARGEKGALRYALTLHASRRFPVRNDPASGIAAHPGHHPKAKPKAKAVPIRVAPADEYFGRMKMSILGIRNQLHDLDLRLHYTPEKSEDVMGSAAFVEDALHDWEHKYPRDPWLAKDVYLLEQLYSRCPTEHGRRSTARAAHWLLARYAKTWYGKQAKTQIGAALK